MWASTYSVWSPSHRRTSEGKNFSEATFLPQSMHSCRKERTPN